MLFSGYVRTFFRVVSFGKASKRRRSYPDPVTVSHGNGVDPERVLPFPQMELQLGGVCPTAL